MAIIATLIARRRDGLGQHIEIPLFDALFESIGLRALSYERNAPPATDFGSGILCMRRRHASDVYCIVVPAYRTVCQSSRPAKLDRPKVSFNFKRLWSDRAATAELQRRLVGVFATRTATEWEDLGRAHGCTLGMLRSIDTWMAEPHAMESGTLVDTQDFEHGNLRVPGAAVRMWGHPETVGAHVTHPAPTMCLLFPPWIP